MTRKFVVAAVALFGVAAVATATSYGADATPNEKVTICHATSSDTNPYTVNTVDESSIDEQHNRYLNGHGDHERDIIPPFRTFPGRNWDEAGQAIWANGCKVPIVLEEVTPLAPGLDPPTCDAPGTVDLPTVIGVEYGTTVNPDGSVTTTATAVEGYVLADGSTTWTHTADQLAQLPADHPECVVVTPPDPPDPPEGPTDPPDVPGEVASDEVVAGEVASDEVVAGEVAAAAPATAPTAVTLPATGNETWAITLIGLAMLLTGSVLHRLSRRPA
jgi:LPXTG-motif cell wall-anchored protein